MEIMLKQAGGVKKGGLSHCSSPLLEQAKQAKPDWEHWPELRRPNSPAAGDCLVTKNVAPS
jgi:hypothetical protein